MTLSERESFVDEVGPSKQVEAMETVGIRPSIWQPMARRMRELVE